MLYAENMNAYKKELKSKCALFLYYVTNTLYTFGLFTVCCEIPLKYKIMLKE